MSPEQKRALIEAIHQALKKTENEITMLEASIQPLAQDCSLEPLTKSELMGEVNLNVTRLTEAQKRHKQLEEALKRSKKGDFGLCAGCGEPILFERLLLMPESVCCVACLQRGECPSDRSPSDRAF